MRACVQSPPTPPLTPPPLPTHQDLAPPCHVVINTRVSSVTGSHENRSAPAYFWEMVRTISFHHNFSGIGISYWNRIDGFFSLNIRE